MAETRFDDKPIFELIKEQSLTHPTKIAIKHNGKTISYGELLIAVDQFAGYIQTQQIKKNDIVVVPMDRSIEMMIALISFLKMGVTYLPILPNYPKERLNYILTNSSTTKILSSNKYRSLYSDYPDTLYFEDFWNTRTNYADKDSDKGDLWNCTAFALYTSGSTGMPKGVEIAQRSFHNHLMSMQKLPGISESDIMLNITTITFDIAQLELFLPLISGAQLFISDMDESRDGRLLLETIESEKISIVQATPFNWQILLESGWNNPLPIKALCGGEALSKDLADKLCKRCKEVWNMYGPTEATIWATIKKISLNDPVITIGKAIHNLQVYILSDDLKEMPVNEVGEIYIGGIGVGKGYINRPELTEKAFIADPFVKATGNRIYKTGDLGIKLENGEIQCLGRIDHQIKIRGNRVETEEIEFQLKQQSNVKNAIVAGHRDSVDNLRLVAYIEPKKAIDEAQLDEHIQLWKLQLENSLPEYMMPTDFMIIDEVPLMPNGKVNRKALPEPIIKASSQELVLPVSELEEELIKIWKRNIGMDRISTNDNFFDLGGNSLIATKIMLQVEQYTGKRIPNATLFQYQTIKELSKFIQENITDSKFKVLVPIKPEGSKLPVYIIHAIGLNLMFLRSFILFLDKEQPVYGLQALGLNGIDKPLDNMEEIARFYISEIVEQNPTGPYLITGYSFGGYIAFEIVKQLKAMGKDVRMLAMIDTNIQEPLHRLPIYERVSKKLMRQWYKLLFRTKVTWENPVDSFNFLRIVYTQMIKSKFIKDYDSENMPPFMMHIAQKLEVAYYNYEIKPYHVKINLFKSEHRMFFVDDPKYLGWKPFALDGIDIHLIPGDHKDMLLPPHDRVFAEIFQKKLNEFN
ncbi:MAG: amino acid adenylation domain-containing protein [Chitinophagaceae bacterium]|nr:amino acid adenylation domain-containing protein [Chitinophagaceae bacterium]